LGSDPELEFIGELGVGDHLFVFDSRIEDGAPFHFEHCRWYDPTIGRCRTKNRFGLLTR
jgi:hypothetical protein